MSCSEKRENLALWLGEYNRLRLAITTLRQQIALLDHHVAPDALAVQRRRRAELKRLLAERKSVLARVQQPYEVLDDRQAQLVDSIPGLGPNGQSLR